MQQINFKQALIIGLAQACALIPGVSRSGATILAARTLNYDRTSCAKFSFLLGTPAMTGAAILHSKDFLLHMDKMEFYLGIGTAFLVGLIAIKIFLTFIQRFGFLCFAVYRIIVGISIYLLFP